MKFDKLLILCFTGFILTLASCSEEKEDRHKLISGDWHGVSWIIDDTNQEYDASRVNFSFDKDGSYTAQLGNREEIGAYRFMGEMLYTHADGQSEIGVKLLRLDRDTMVMQMNRGGQMESLTLASGESSD
jgi:hypothetical protein